MGPLSALEPRARASRADRWGFGASNVLRFINRSHTVQGQSLQKLVLVVP